MGSLFATILVLAAAPAGRTASAIPEPTHLALYALGFAGLIIGRHMAKNRKDRDED